MRKILAVLLIGFVISGCNDEEKRFDGTTVNDQSANGNPPGSNQPGNSAPTISGNPPQAILYSDTYNFSPLASDPDGDSLSFTIRNRPQWASFSPTTGRLYGQPSIGDIGTYNDIVISVSDGKTSRSLPSFSIDVSQAALGSVTLSWNAPTENEDGSALTDLAGYEIYYGRDSGDYNQSIRIDNPGITTYVVEQLAPGTYFFAATAFNDSGVESRFSGELIHTLN